MIRDLIRAVTVAAVASGVAAIPVAAGPPTPQTIDRPHTIDFDGDGYADLAIGSPRADVGGDNDAGTVTILYGGNSGLSTNGSQVWHQDSPGVQDKAEAGDRFGASLAAGDFDNDGRADLAIGIPGEDITISGDAVSNLGAIQVLFGSPSGLTARDRFYHFTPGQSVQDKFTDGQLGWALATVDVFGTSGPGEDGRADLAIGIPGYHNDRGAIGLVSGQQLTPELMSGIAGFNTFEGAHPGDRTGATLAAGDFDSDVTDDVVIGAPFWDGPLSPGTSAPDAGRVIVLYNGDLDDEDAIAEGLVSVGGTFAAGEHFGAALLATSIGGNYDALFVGVPNEDHSGKVDAGILYRFLSQNDGSGVNKSSGLVMRLGDPFFGGAPKAGDHFGAAFGWGDFGFGVAQDMAVGMPGRDVGAAEKAGAVAILYNEGIPFGQVIRAGFGGYAGQSEGGDAFGASLFAGDFGAQDYGDLAIGIPSEDVGSLTNAGAVQVLYGDLDEGLAPGDDDLWTVDSPGVPRQAAPGDRFGSSVR